MIRRLQIATASDTSLETKGYPRCITPSVKKPKYDATNAGYTVQLFLKSRALVPELVKYTSSCFTVALIQGDCFFDHVESSLEYVTF